MNKPNWEDAPKWANWLAMDANGTWWWYEAEPYIGWQSQSVTVYEQCSDEPSDPLITELAKIYAKDSLEKRP